MRTDILAEVKQSGSPGHDEGDEEILSMTRQGQLLTVNERDKLAAAGLCWVVDVGSFTVGADVIKYSGGGFGTTIDQDQPEIAIGVDAGYYLIPLEIKVAASADIDADAEVAHIVAYADRVASVPTAATCQAGGGVQTPVNLLDGAAGFPGTAYTLISTDITDPTVSEILDFETLIYTSVGTYGIANVVSLKMEYEPESPSRLAGPCSIYVHWGGTGIVMAMARVVVACVPSSWFA